MNSLQLDLKQEKYSHIQLFEPKMKLFEKNIKSKLQKKINKQKIRLQLILKIKNQNYSLPDVIIIWNA